MSAGHAHDDDSTLISRHLSGEEGAFASLVEKHQARVCSLLSTILRDHHLAEEWATEAFVRASQNLTKLKKTERFGAWVTRIAMNLAYDEVRRQAKRRSAEKKWVGHSATRKESGVRESLEEKVWEELDKLPRRQWEVVTLYYWARESYKQIGERLGISETAVRRRIGRARRALQRELVRWL